MAPREQYEGGAHRVDAAAAGTILGIVACGVARTGVAAQSFVEAVCDRDDQAPRFLIRDRDSIYGATFRPRVKGFGTKCLVTPPRAPQARAYCERVIRTLR